MWITIYAFCFPRWLVSKRCTLSSRGRMFFWNRPPQQPAVRGWHDMTLSRRGLNYTVIDGANQ